MSILEKNLSNHVVIQLCYNALWFFLCVFFTAIHSTSKGAQILVCSVTRYIRNVTNVTCVTWSHAHFCDFIHHSINTWYVTVYIREYFSLNIKKHLNFRSSLFWTRLNVNVQSESSQLSLYNLYFLILQSPQSHESDYTVRAKTLQHLRIALPQVRRLKNSGQSESIVTFELIF